MQKTYKFDLKSIYIEEDKYANKNVKNEAIYEEVSLSTGNYQAFIKAN
jgi:hypothetical protein